MVAPAGCTTASLTPLLYGDALKRFPQSALSTSNPNTITLENHLTPTGESQGHSEYLPPCWRARVRGKGPSPAMFV